MRRDSRLGRRRFLGACAAASAAGLAGCRTPTDDGDGAVTIPPLAEFRGSGALVAGRPAPGGTSMEELPDLSGSLNLYIGGGEGGIYFRLVELLQEIYPDFQVFASSASSSSLAQTVIEEVEAGSPQADVFWSIDASSLGYVADNGAYEPLPDEVVAPVPQTFRGRENAWAGVTGRARSVPYNTEQSSGDDVPDSIGAFPDAGLGTLGWAPTYGAFKSFVTAMRLLWGPDATREWLVAMREAGTERFPDELVISGQVADGALDAGLANHYYAMRVKNQRPDAPIDLAFTKNDAGALVDVSGALRIDGTSKGDLVNDFVRHLLSAEAQEFFATVSFAYPMIEDAAPVGGLPTIDELDPPDLNLSELSELEPTLEIMRQAGVLG